MEVVDNLPDEHHVYMRVHKQNIDFKATSPNRMIRPVAFDAKGEGGLSVDWSKYSTPQQSLERAKVPESNGVISMPIKGIRANPLPLSVLHVPEETNYSHSEIFGIPPRKPSDMGVRVKLMDLSIWEIDCKE
ncbi:hypothetical protein [Flavobacterium saliperosum]|uniref:Uncharacterized protein n=1 Tax=Flavobacterium saliperosum TaxID=329186 RepID=A0A1G4W9E9_9FLAO|nr:hypothetical protein [Flavobacterium saliperosum]SCX18957.1 hypothetical protein SAMN02927925_02759 [Flavobacterium saliperosum]